MFQLLRRWHDDTRIIKFEDVQQDPRQLLDKWECPPVNQMCCEIQQILEIVKSHKMDVRPIHQMHTRIRDTKRHIREIKSRLDMLEVTQRMQD
jgi:hypothetical protein